MIFLRFIIFASVAVGTICSFRKNDAVPKKYYFNISGNDKNDGSINHPFQSLSKLNSLPLHAGDAIYLNAGDVFKGSIYVDSTKCGVENAPITISPYGDGSAIIDAGNANAFTAYGSSFLNISNLNFKGTGRKNGNTKDGVVISNCKNITIKNLEITGFQKSGLLVYSSVNITNVNVYAHNNGSAGITVEGNFSNKLTSRNITFTECQAVNNAGDPTNLTNHSGNGIVVGHCTNVTIDKCMATDNGWDMPRIGNGPVGIWAYEADSVTIQHCLSYRNKTSVGGADGGGFDLDGGVTNSVIQYCYSYENQGAGYCMFQYWGASPWHDNVIRFNISENDGSVSDAHGGAYVWNSSDDAAQFYNSDFYNNTIYNSKEAALSYSEKSERKNFRFINNIFMGRDSLIRGAKGSDIFMGNDWWSIISHFNADKMDDFSAWAKKYKIESVAGTVVGLNIDPLFNRKDEPEINSADDLQQFLYYKLPEKSLLRTNGVDLKTTYSIENGGMDFFSNPAPVNGIGACF